MFLIYDSEDCYPRPQPPPFMDRQVIVLMHVRSDSFDKTQIQKWVVETDGVDPKGGKNYVYNHYVPHSRIFSAIRNCITTQEMSRRTALEWLMDLTEHLAIKPDQQLQTTNWEESRVAYDMWVDWAIDAVCNWKFNIFYGPGSGDHRGTSLDIPDSDTQRKRVKKAADLLATWIPDPDLLEAKIPVEPLAQESDDDDNISLGDLKRDKKSQQLWQQFLDSSKLIPVDANDQKYDSGEDGFDETDEHRPEKLNKKIKKLYSIQTRSKSLTAYQKRTKRAPKRR